MTMVTTQGSPALMRTLCHRVFGLGAPRMMRDTIRGGPIRSLLPCPSDEPSKTLQMKSFVHSERPNLSNA